MAPVFDEHSASRKQHGCTDERVYRAAHDRNAICVVMSYPSREHTEAFIADPSLQDAMHRAGVTAPPSIHISDTE